MKTYFCFALAVFCAWAGPTSNPLVADLDKIIDAIPWFKILNLVDDHLLQDPQFANAMNYLGSAPFEAALKKTTSSPEFHAILEYLGRETVEAIETAFAIGIKNQKSQKHSSSGRTFKTFLNALAEVLPKAKIQNVIKSLLSSSSVFKSFYTKVTAPQFNTLVENFLNAPSVSEIWKTIEAKGIDIRELWNVIKGVFIA